MPADADGDDDIDGADFLHWQRQLGVGQLAPASTPAPEPATTALAAMAAIAWAAVARWRSFH
jgi:hypothetical protein